MDVTTFEELPLAFKQMAQQNADRVATEVRKRLLDCGLVSVSPGGDVDLLYLPPQYWPVLLLELAAACQLRHWEAQGLGDVLGPLPSFCDALEGICNRLVDRPASFLSLDNAELCHAVNEVFCSSFAWEAEPILGATMAVRIEDVDSVLDAIAELLWTKRTR